MSAHNSREEGEMGDVTRMVLCRSDAGDGGWSLHPPGTTDDEIASGDARILASGDAERTTDGHWSRPDPADYLRAEMAYRRITSRDDMMTASSEMEDAKKAIEAAMQNAERTSDEDQMNSIAQQNDRPVRVVITIEGGVVQHASADGPCDIVVVDYDDHGEDGGLPIVRRYGVITNHSARAAVWVNTIHDELANRAT
jgi:hypothetical protein